MLRIAPFASGSGTTLFSIGKAIQSGELKGVEIACVILSRRQIGAYDKCLEVGIPKERISVLRRRDFGYDEDSYGEAILRVCDQYGVDLIGQYGWLVLTPRVVVERYRTMSINQHPGPPEFGGEQMHGIHVHAAVLHFAKHCGRPFYTEATAQRVDEQYDKGAVLGRHVLEINPDDTPQSLAMRLLPHEWDLQKRVLQQFADGTVAELVRQTPLIHPDEIPLLEEAKRLAAQYKD